MNPHQPLPQQTPGPLPQGTSFILNGHSDEVWNMAWSHDGLLLASVGRDNTAIIWRAKDPSLNPGTPLQEWTQLHVLRERPYPGSCLAWSLDDKILLTNSELMQVLILQTGVCIRTLEEHTEAVTALSWLPNGNGFITGGLDRKIIYWDPNGEVKDVWHLTNLQVTDFALTPDFTQLVVVGYAEGIGSDGKEPESQHKSNVSVFEWETKKQVWSNSLEGQVTSVKASRNSQYALINCSLSTSTMPEVSLWDISKEKLTRKYTGHHQERHVVRSCFGGVDENLVFSGSKDGKVYIWHRDSGALLEVLEGHGEGTVNSVAWSPTSPWALVSCADDHTLRVWELKLSSISPAPK